MKTLSPQSLLAVWETGVRYQAIDRSLLLFALAEPALDPNLLADLPLSRRNASILSLRCAYFGNPFSVWIDCPHCTNRMEMQIDVGQLPPSPDNADQVLNIDGMTFRRPTTRDQAQLNTARDASEAARDWLKRCAADPASLPKDAPGLDTWLARLDEALEQHDPWASLTLAATCPDCGQGFVAELDATTLLWDELSALAQRTLTEVHTLASTYGWSEGAILAMSSVRREAYLRRLVS